MTIARACARCGSEAGATQEYCLDCGYRLGRAPQALHWLWPTLAALVIAAVGATIAVAANRSDGSEATVVALSPLRPAPPAKVEAGLVAWPRRDGYTIVLATVPAKSTGKLADTRARRAVRSQLSDVGILASSDFASLHPGYQVVFTGIYGSLEDAQAALSRARSAFGNAYVQQITR